MIRTALTYHAPQRPEQACALLAEHSADAAVLGGGTTLLPAMTRGDRTHLHVVDLRRLGLAGIEPVGEEAEIGAMTTYSALLTSPHLDGLAALVRLAAGGITGGTQLRNQGTIGGSASYANPASDIPAVLVAVNAQMRLHGPDGVREMAAGEFFRDAFETASTVGEVLTAIRVPRRAARIGYYKLKLSESSWPIATAAARAEIVDGRLVSAAVTIGAVCRTPVTVDVTGLVDNTGRITGSVAELASSSTITSTRRGKTNWPQPAIAGR